MWGRIALSVALAISVSACANTKGLNDTLNTISKNYEHCHHTATYTVSVGAMNPGSGAQIQGNIDCPALTTTPQPITGQ